MKISDLENVSPKYIFFGALLLWLGVCFLFGLFRLDAFDLDEGAAHGLLLNWSVSDQIANPIFILGAPDFRALLYLPLGMYWTGNIFAAKVLSSIFGFLAVAVLYRWAHRTNSQESALVAASLLLISPLLIGQIDSMGAAPVILLVIGLGVWLDELYRKSEKPYGARYFLQLLLIAVLVTLHPIGLAYPVALLAWWKFNPVTTKSNRHIYLGIGIATFVAIAITGGWKQIEFFGNPVKAIAQVLTGGVVYGSEDLNWVAAVFALVILGVVLVMDRKFFRNDLMGMTFAIMFGVGLIMADKTWAATIIAIALFRFVPILTRLSFSRGSMGFLGQRGVLVGVSFVISLFFMFQVKAHAMGIKFGVLGPEDELIQAVSVIAKDETKAFRVASQWPARTMIVVKRDVLPLPPAFATPEELKNQALRGLTHLVFDPYKKQNVDFAKTLSMLPEETETVALMKAGAIIAVRNHEVRLHVRPGDKTQGSAVPATTTETPPTDAPPVAD